MTAYEIEFEVNELSEKQIDQVYADHDALVSGEVDRTFLTITAHGRDVDDAERSITQALAPIGVTVQATVRRELMTDATEA